MAIPKKVLRFPPPPPDPPKDRGQRIVCTIGRERFAIHFHTEVLPPVAPVIPIQKEVKK